MDTETFDKFKKELTVDEFKKELTEWLTTCITQEKKTKWPWKEMTIFLLGLIVGILLML